LWCIVGGDQVICSAQVVYWYTERLGILMGGDLIVTFIAGIRG